MIYAILAGLIVAAGLTVWAIVERTRATTARREAAEARTLADTVSAARKVEQVTSTEREKRLELVIAQARAEIAQLDASLAECRDPRTIAARLSRLLGGQP